MEEEPPLVRDLYPELIDELVGLLEEEGEHWLAICAWDVRMIAECGCRDDFCQSIRTSEHPGGQPYGPGYRCLPLLPAQGDLILDVVHGRIMYIEILERPPMRRGAGGRPEGGAVQQPALPA